MNLYVKIADEIDGLPYDDLLDRHMALLRSIGVSDDKMPTSGPRLTQVAAVFLTALMARPGTTLSYDTLFDIRPNAQEAGEAVRIVNTQVCLLRAALRRAGLNYAIENVRGVGYRVPVESADILRATFWTPAP